MQYLGIDWGTRRAAWCAMDERGELVEGSVPADEDGLARLVHTLGPDVRGCVEMMSAAVWVRERLRRSHPWPSARPPADALVTLLSPLGSFISMRLLS